MTPLNPAASGRSPNGRFTMGNKMGKGNPLNRRAQELRAVLLGAVTDEDMQAVIAVLVDKAKEGDVPAIRELLDRAIGKAPQSLELTGADGEALSMPSLTLVLMDVLTGFPEARAAVAARLLTMSHEQPGNDGGGA